MAAIYNFKQRHDSIVWMIDEQWNLHKPLPIQTMVLLFSLIEIKPEFSFKIFDNHTLPFRIGS